MVIGCDDICWPLVSSCPHKILTCFSALICFHQGLSTATKDTYDALHMQTLSPR